MKNKTFADSLKCAFRGMGYAFKTEKNFLYYAVIALGFLGLNVLCRVPLHGYLTYLITAFGVFSAEMINTSIEHLCDMEVSEIKYEVKLVKDMAAAGVLMWGIAFFLAEFIILAYAVYPAFFS